MWHTFKVTDEWQDGSYDDISLPCKYEVQYFSLGSTKKQVFPENIPSREMVYIEKHNFMLD